MWMIRASRLAAKTTWRGTQTGRHGRSGGCCRGDEAPRLSSSSASPPARTGHVGTWAAAALPIVVVATAGVLGGGDDLSPRSEQRAGSRAVAAAREEEEPRVTRAADVADEAEQ